MEFSGFGVRTPLSPSEEVREYGRAWMRGFFSRAEVDTLALFAGAGEKPGARLQLTAPLSEFVGPESRLGKMMRAFAVDACPVRIVAFNKTEAANWSVPWHQDRVIAVARRVEASGYENWIPQAGFWHCEAPISILSQMVFVRIHIDPDRPDNGPLQLALRSHLKGKIPACDAAAVAAQTEIETCIGESGDVLVVHALTLHRSASARIPSERRALRVDYAQRRLLEFPLEWAVSA
jgi:hypothetical protein